MASTVKFIKMLYTLQNNNTLYRQYKYLLQQVLLQVKVLKVGNKICTKASKGIHVNFVH